MLQNAAVLQLLGVALHDVVDLLELVGQPLLAAELVLLQGEDQLLVVLHSVTEKRKHFIIFSSKVNEGSRCELKALLAQVLEDLKFSLFPLNTELV